MSENITGRLADNIKKLREERGMSQQALADAIGMPRPTSSTWENNRSEPSTTNLIALARELRVSLDVLVGNSTESKAVVVVDTSVLYKRPAMIDELVEKFDEVIVPYIVGTELNGLKDSDRGTGNSAWLAMKNLKEKIDAGVVSYVASPRKDGIPDERIFAVAVERARKSIDDRVYMFSDDIYFSFLAKEGNLSNLEALTFDAYGEKFAALPERDVIRSQEFFSLVKSRRTNDVKAFDMRGVDLNMHDPETGLTPLIQAVRSRNLRLVEYLVNLPGIDLDLPDQQKYGFTPLLHAAQLKDAAFDIFKLLVERVDCEKGSVGKNAGNTPLMVCAWGGFRRGVEYLLAHRIRVNDLHTRRICVNQQDTNGFTALIKACIKGWHDIALLLAKDTDITIRSHENKGAEAYIEQRSGDPLAKLLVEEMKRQLEDIA